MEMVLENLNKQNPGANRIEALKTLTKLLLYEVESLAGISPSKNHQSTEIFINLTDKVERFEISLICNALISTNGNQRKEAKMLGMKNTTLHSKIKRYAIDSFNIIGQFSADHILSETD